MKSLFLVQVFKNGKLSKQFVSRAPGKWVERYKNNPVYSVLTSSILELNLI